MNKDDMAILKSIQKNTEMAMIAIEAIEQKVYDRDMELLLAKNNQKYSKLHQEAISKMLEEKILPHKVGTMENIILTSSLNMNTLLNTSTSHIAELMLKGSNAGIIEMKKTLNHHKCGEKVTKTMAEEFLEMEKENMEMYTKYL